MTGLIVLIDRNRRAVVGSGPVSIYLVPAFLVVVGLIVIVAGAMSRRAVLFPIVMGSVVTVFGVTLGWLMRRVHRSG